MTSVTLTFDLWPWPFAWTLRWSLVITPENFMMIRWWEHSQKGVTDRWTKYMIVCVLFQRNHDKKNGDHNKALITSGPFYTTWDMAPIGIKTPLFSRLDCSNSIANALELLQSCTKPSIYCLVTAEILVIPQFLFSKLPISQAWLN